MISANNDSDVDKGIVDSTPLGNKTGEANEKKPKQQKKRVKNRTYEKLITTDGFCNSLIR